MSIAFANICSSVKDHRQKFISLKFKYWFWKNKREQWNLQRKLMLHARVWRLPESEDPQKLTARSWRYQASEDPQKLKIIRVWRLKAAVC